MSLIDLSLGRTPDISRQAQKHFCQTPTAPSRLFVFSRRPKLLITNPIEPLYEMYKQLGLKTVGREPVEHPHAFNVRVWLMYGRFDEMSKPYFM